MSIHPVPGFSALLASLIVSLAAFGQDVNFEEISEIKTKFEPWGGIVSRGDGFFYGAARWSEDATGGVIYRLAPHQDSEILYRFPVVEDGSQANLGGSNPSCGLVLGSDGAFYGATSSGGAHGMGTIYRISADGIFSVVHDLRIADGYDVHGLVATEAGELYGTTEGGKYDGGTLFRIGPDGDFRTVFAFQKTAVPPPWEPLEPGFRVEPNSPWHLSVGTDGRIYGTTSSGGPITGPFRFTYGTFFRYDGPGKITVLCEFDSLKENPNSNKAADNGFYVTTENKLVHVSMDGTLTVIADFTSSEFGNMSHMYLGRVLVLPEGVYGEALYGGTSDSGIVYRHTPGGATVILHHFSEEYRSRLRCLAAGNDGLVYGLAAFPEGYSASASAARGVYPEPAVSTGPRTFRFRQSDSTSANFFPSAKLDVAWLPPAGKKGFRKVFVDVLANDSDPDSNPLIVSGVSHSGPGLAKMVPTASGPRLLFSTTEADPASQLLSYQVSDGQGGSSTGYVAIRTPAAGVYTGKATRIHDPEFPASPISLTIDQKNVVTATFVLSGRIFTGKGTLDVDDTADLNLTRKGRVSKLLHISLQRGKTRTINVRIVGSNAVYTATCNQVTKR